jgi:hypothetical protein
MEKAGRPGGGARLFCGIEAGANGKQLHWRELAPGLFFHPAPDSGSECFNAATWR